MNPLRLQKEKQPWEAVSEFFSIRTITKIGVFMYPLFLQKILFGEFPTYILQKEPLKYTIQQNIDLFESKND